MLLDLLFSGEPERVTDIRERLSHSSENFAQGGSVERFDVGPPQRQRLIDWLPASVELGTLGLTEVAVTLETLGVAKFQAVGAPEIPRRACYWNSHFPERRPGIAATAGCLTVSRASGLPGNGQRIGLIREGVPEVRSTNREANGATWQIKH